VNNTQNRASESREHATDSLKKSAEQVDVKSATELLMNQADVAGATGEIMGSIESSESAEASEGFKEGEKQGKAKQGSGSSQQDNAAVASAHAHIHPLPPPPKMRKEVTRAIRQEIRKEERKIILAYVGLKKVSPDRLAEMVAQLRQLKDLLASLLDATADILKGLYLKWVRGEAN
jgi:hypothetical protein